MALLNPELTQLQNAQTPNYNQKLVLEPRDVSLDYILAKDGGRNYEIQFAVQINPPAHKIDPSKPISPSSVSMQSLRDAILGSIRNRDRKYMILKRFDTRKAIFHFDHDKWFKDSAGGISPSTNISRFQREFKFKVSPPPMLLTTFVRHPMEKFIVRKFKDYLESTRKEAKYFRALIPPNFRSNARTRIRNMFEWEYDTQWNKIKATLKPVYILALLYATGQAVKKMKELKPQDVKDSQKRLFADKVKKNMRTFDRKKWEKFIKRKFI